MAERKPQRDEKILVVDDEVMISRLISHYLEAEGYRVTTAASGREALAKIQTEAPALVILDVMLPEMNGLELCARLRERPETATLPVILLSALTNVPDRIRGLQAGADEYVTKPVDMAELVARVGALLSRTRRLQQAQPSHGQGKVLAFMGVKGGVGTTTVAFNIASALVQLKKSVILVELRPCFGTLSIQMKCSPPDTLASLLDLDPIRISGREISSRLFHAPSGLNALFGPQQAADFRPLNADQAEAIVRHAAGLAEFVVIDLPAQPSDASQAATGCSDTVALVLEPEWNSVGAAKVVLDLLKSWKVGMAQVGGVVVNRTALSVSINARDLRSQIGCELLGLVPGAGDQLVAAQERGVSLVAFRPDSFAASAFTEMANRLIAPTLVGIRI